MPQFSLALICIDRHWAVIEGVLLFVLEFSACLQMLGFIWEDFKMEIRAISVYNLINLLLILGKLNKSNNLQDLSRYKEDYLTFIPIHLRDGNTCRNSWFKYVISLIFNCLRRIEKELQLSILFCPIVRNQTSQDSNNIHIHDITNNSHFTICASTSYKTPKIFQKCIPNYWKQNVVSISRPLGSITLGRKQFAILTYNIHISNSGSGLNITFATFQSYYPGDHCNYRGNTILNKWGLLLRDYVVSVERIPKRRKGKKCKNKNKCKIRNRIRMYGFFCGLRYPFTIYTSSHILIVIQNTTSFKSLILEYQVNYQHLARSLNSQVSYKSLRSKYTSPFNKLHPHHQKLMARLKHNATYLLYGESFISKKFIVLTSGRVIFRLSDVSSQANLFAECYKISLFSFYLVGNKFHSIEISQLSGKVLKQTLWALTNEVYD